MNPKKKSKELKRISRENLNGRYRLSMSVFLTVTLINLFSDLPFTYLLGNVYATKVQTVIYYIAEVLLSIVVGVLQMGLIRFHLNMARKKECRISDVFYCFMNHSNRYFGAYIIYYAISMIAKAPFLVARNFFQAKRRHYGNCYLFICYKRRAQLYCTGSVSVLPVSGTLSR